MMHRYDLGYKIGKNRLQITTWHIEDMRRCFIATANAREELNIRGRIQWDRERRQKMDGAKGKPTLPVLTLQSRPETPRMGLHLRQWQSQTIKGSGNIAAPLDANRNQSKLAPPPPHLPSSFFHTQQRYGHGHAKDGKQTHGKLNHSFLEAKGQDCCS